MNSDLRTKIIEVVNRDDYTNLSYTPKLLQLGSTLPTYPVGLDINYVSTKPYTDIEDIEFKNLSPYQTELNNLKSDRKQRPSYYQKIDVVEYNEALFQKSNAGEVTSKVFRKANILMDKAIWYGDNSNNVGFYNNPYSVKESLGALTTAQELYTAIINKYIGMSSVIQADTTNRKIVITESAKAILMNPAGANSDTANYFTRLVNELLLGDGSRIVEVPDFIFNTSQFFAIIETSLINYHFTSFPKEVDKGNLKLNQYWIFAMFSTMVDVLENGACSIYEYTYNLSGVQGTRQQQIPAPTNTPTNKKNRDNI